MQDQASKRLERNIPKIMSLWEERTYEEVSSAIHQKSSALRNSLPEFLTLIATALSTTINRTQVRVKRDRAESFRIGKKHGLERATSRDYTMEELIFEYHILRQVICEVMEEEAPLTSIEREVISCAVEQAVNDAANEYSDTLKTIQEKLTNTLTHDLRGPITATKISAQTISKDPETNAKSLKIANRIANSMNRLEAMIRDILDASRIRTGAGLSLELKELDLDAVIRDEIEDLNFSYDDRIDFVSSGLCSGYGNEDGLRRIIENLVTNAIKYGDPKEQIKVEFKSTVDDIQITVHNKGNPIPTDEQAILFQQFRRSKETESKPGWGLGLTVVKGLTEAHEGSVTVESNLDHGTSFTVKLPRYSQRNLAPANASIRPNP